MLESIPKLGRRSAIFVFYICQNYLFWNQAELFSHRWHLCCPLWVLKNGWLVLVFPPHICKSLSLLVLWCHQPGPGPLNPCGLPESRLASPPWTSVPRPQAKLSLGLVVWSTLSLIETRKLLGQTSAPGQAFPLCRGPILLFSLLPTDQKISFHFSFWVIFSYGYISFHWVFLCFMLFLQPSQL